jgi:hypothetical protein
MRLLYIFVLAALVAACGPQAQPTATPEPAPYGLVEPFLSAWRAAGGEALGPPRTPPLWIDGRLVQLFAGVKIVAGDQAGALVDPQPANWEQQLPAELLALEAASQRVTIKVQHVREPPAVEPLRPLMIEVTVTGYSGPVELRFYDSTLDEVSRVSLRIEHGAGLGELLPAGALGPQWALALIDGRQAGAQSGLFKLVAETTVQTGLADLDKLYPRLKSFMEQAAISYRLDDQPVRGYRSPDNPLLWLRDHVYQGRGFRYFEQDVTSALDAFRRAQFADGSFPDVLDYPERFTTAFRKEVEADLEFLFIQGVYEAWQMTGNDAWLATNLPAMRKAVMYITSDPLRWDEERGLIKRPFTIDMWDFSYGPTTLSPDGKPAPRHWIDETTVWGVFHGDNTGLIRALELLALTEVRVGDPANAARYRALAEQMLERLNNLAWNGDFFTHFVPSDQDFQVPGVDIKEQLSLSNAYALNRGILSERQGEAIINSYFRRRDFDRAFAEWYSIDPPFPAGSYGMGGGKGEQPGEYVNGGIMPLVGGELARGAFRYGSEPYGFDILRRYAALTELTGESYLWYYPDGRAGISGPNTLATDGWGAGAMIGALIEGAAGVSDRGSRFSDLVLSPRWSALPEMRNAYVVARYAASTGYVAYTWEQGERSMGLHLSSSAKRVFVRLLLPKDAPETLQGTLNGQPIEVGLQRDIRSRYATVRIEGGIGEVVVSW